MYCGNTNHLSGCEQPVWWTVGRCPSLGKYLRKSANKYRDRYLSTFGESVDSAILERMVEERVKDELRSGVQTIQYQIKHIDDDQWTVSVCYVVLES